MILEFTFPYPVSIPVLNIDVGLPTFILACFVLLVVYQHLEADKNVDKVSSSAIKKSSAKTPAAPRASKATSAKKKVSAKKRRAKTPRVSVAKSPAAKKNNAQTLLANEFSKVFKGVSKGF